MGGAWRYLSSQAGQRHVDMEHNYALGQGRPRRRLRADLSIFNPPAPKFTVDYDA